MITPSKVKHTKQDVEDAAILKNAAKKTPVRAERREADYWKREQEIAWMIEAKVAQALRILKVYPHPRRVKPIAQVSAPDEL